MTTKPHTFYIRFQSNSESYDQHNCLGPSLGGLDFLKFMVEVFSSSTRENTLGEREREREREKEFISDRFIQLSKYTAQIKSHFLSKYSFDFFSLSSFRSPCMVNIGEFLYLSVWAKITL